MLALSLPVLIGAMSLAADIGVLYVNHAMLQRAADAAVLAGATYLPANPAAARAAARQYAIGNGVAAREITNSQVASDRLSIALSLRRNVPYYFGRAIGLSSTNINASATASLQSIVSALGVVPIGINSRVEITPNRQVTLQGGQLGSDWVPLFFSRPAASLYLRQIAAGFPKSVALGGVFSIGQTNLIAATAPALLARVIAGEQADPVATYRNHGLSDPRTIVVPIVTVTAGAASSAAIEGFAEFWLTGASGAGNISGYFIDQVAPDSLPDPKAPVFGAFAPILTA